MPIPAIADAPLTTRTRRYAPDQVMPAHADRRTLLSIVVAGQVHESAGRRDEYATAGSMVIKPGHVVHRNRFGPDGARLLSIDLPDWLLAGQPAALVDRWRWFHGGPLVVLATRVWLAVRQRPDDHAGLADRLVETIAAAGELGARAHGSPPAWLARVRQQLREAGAAGCGLRVLAAGAGVHPVYLARMFRRYYRCSVSDYCQAVRLSAALERMAATPAPLAAIAAASGYADQSHLSRACRRGLGTTPGRCRRLLSDT